MPEKRGPGLAQPHEVAAVFTLVLPVDPHRVVRRRALEVVAPGLLRVVRVGARVDQDFFAACGQGEGQGIGMAVCRDRQVAQWPGVGHQPHFVGLAQARAQQVVATFGKRHARCVCWVGSADPVPRHKRVRAEQPAGLVVEPPGLVLEVGSLEQQRATRQQRAVRAPIGLVAHANQLRIVGVADHRHMACHVHQRRHEFGQPFQPVEVGGGKDDAVDLPHAKAHQHHVHHFVLVVDGLLAVDAVGAVLEQALRHEAIESAALPPGAFGPAGPRDAGNEEAHGLAQQVIVGRRME